MRRRTVVTRSAVVGVSAAFALAGCSSGSATATSAVASSGASSTHSATATPSASLSPPASSSPSTSASDSPYAIVLKRTSPDGARAVAFTVDLHGDVPRQKDPAGGTVIEASNTQVLGTYVQWGDGGTSGTDAGDVECVAGGERVPVRVTYTYSHTFAKPGRYTVTFTAGACPTPTEETRTFTVTVR